MCHVSPLLKAIATDSLLLTPPPCTVGWFAKIVICDLGNQPIYQKLNKKQKINKKGFISFVILAINSLTRSLQTMWFWVLVEGTQNTQSQAHTDITTYRLNWPTPDLFVVLTAHL